jgi:hypothetical protein
MEKVGKEVEEALKRKFSFYLYCRRLMQRRHMKLCMLQGCECENLQKKWCEARTGGRIRCERCWEWVEEGEI